MHDKNILAVVRLMLSALSAGAALAAVPVRWTAETSRVQPIALDAWRGDTLALECTLKSYGQPVAPGAATASLMWQTNGMGSAWWQTNATVSADGVIRATWSPSMDPGAPSVAFFLPVQTGDGASYRAAGTLRFRPSPGSGSQIAALPQPGGTLDFGEFNLVNAPWATLAAANEAILAAVTSATGALVIPPPVDLTPYATTGYVHSVSTALANDIQLALNASSNYTDQVASSLSASITSSTNSLGTVLRDNIAESSATSRAYADGVASNAQAYADAVASNAQRSAIAAIPSLAGYATETYVDSAISAIDMPSLSGYATTAYADVAASNAQAASIAAIPSLAGYATQSYVADYFATNYTPPDLSSYASRSYADEAASNAQAAAIAAIPSLAGYATQAYVADYFSTNYTPPDLSSYASRSYADSAASNAQAAAIAAIPSLSGYATETYAQNAASSAASDALSAAQSYARDLSWGASQGNTRLVSLDGTIWQDATGTVWQVSYIYGWSGTVIDLQTSAARPITFSYAGRISSAPDITLPTDYWSAGNGTNIYYDAEMGLSWVLWMTNDYHGVTNEYWFADGNPPIPSTATNLSFNTTFELYSLFYQPVALSTNPVDHVLYEQSPVLRDIIAEQSTGTVARALTYGTPTRWTDATGCVWQVDLGYQKIIYIYYAPYELSIDSPTILKWDEVGGIYSLFYYKTTHEWEYSNTGGNWTNKQEIVLGQQTITLYDRFENEDPISFDLTYAPTTNLVGRVALTNDLPGAIISTISDFASTGTVHAAESSTYSSRLFDASYDSAYDATYLIRESTNAATAVTSSLIRYALVTPGEWAFSGDGMQDFVTYEVRYESGESQPGAHYVFSLYGDDNLLDGVSVEDENPLSLTFANYHITATRPSLPGNLCDRAVNAMSISSITNITLPALSHPGQARDFILLLDIPSSVTNTVPAITNLLTFTASGTETIHYYVDGDDPSTATFPLPTSPGTWSYSFSEFKTSWFAVSLKPIVEAAAPGGAQ